MWGNWFRLFTYALSTVSSLSGLIAILFFRAKRTLLLFVVVGLSLSLVCTVYNVLFGLRTPAVLLCQGDIAEICMENVTCRVDLSILKGPQAFIFSFSLCALLCFQSAALSSLITQIYRSIPAAKHSETVVVPDISNSSSQLDVANLISPESHPAGLPPVPAPFSESEAMEVLSVESGANRAVESALIPPVKVSGGRGRKK
jgi:hypothetical protein